MKKTTFCLLALVASCFTASVALASDGQGHHETSICHRTHSESNPYVLITVDDSAVPAHFREHGDDVLPRNGECPATSAGWPPDPPADTGGGSGDPGGGTL